MTLTAAAQLLFSTLVFLAGATSAKAWGLQPTTPKLLLTLGLYTVGNLIMLYLVRVLGMSIAFSLSAVIQLIAVNLVALLWFDEKLNLLQGIGIVFAILAVALISFGPYFNSR